MILQAPYTSYACSHAYLFIFEFENPGKATLYTEYIIHDLISTVGNVGGTLGIFIGFSFSGFIGFALNLILKLINFFEKKKRFNRVTDIQESSKGTGCAEKT